MNMDHNYECHHQNFNLKAMTRAIRPSLLRHHHINFNFNFELNCFNWPQNLDSMSPEFIRQHAPHITYTSDNVTVKKSLSYEDMQEAVERVLTPLPALSDNERQQLIELACIRGSLCNSWDPTLNTIVKIRYVNTIDLEFQLFLVYDHVFYSWDDDDEFSQVRMVPARDSSVRSLKKHENIGCGIITESCCCICLEDFSEDIQGCEALLCMPCEHVFDRDCIKN